MEHNTPHATFTGKYKQSNDKHNWSPKSKRRLSHRVFTDSTEKRAMNNMKLDMIILISHVMVMI